MLGPQTIDKPLLIVYSIIFITIVIVGLVGNLCTINFLLRWKQHRTATDIYLVNLALTDVLALTFSTPIELLSFYQMYPFTFGNGFCKFRSMLAESVNYCSILTILCFTVERYFAICHPIIWVISFILATPYVFNHVQPHGIRFQTQLLTQSNIFKKYHVRMNNSEPFQYSLNTTITYLNETMSEKYFQYLNNKTDCFRSLISSNEMSTKQYGIDALNNLNLLQNQSSENIYTIRIAKYLQMTQMCDVPSNMRDIYNKLFIATSIIFFIIPMTVIAIFYILISFRLVRRDSVIRQTRQNHSSHNKAINMLITVVVAFALCWSPFHLQRILSAQNIDPGNRFLHIVYYISGISVPFNSTINPILYNIMSKKYRHAFLLILCGRFARKYLKENTYSLSPTNRRSIRQPETLVWRNDKNGTDIRNNLEENEEEKKTMKWNNWTRRICHLKIIRNNSHNNSSNNKLENDLNNGTNKIKFKKSDILQKHHQSPSFEV
ncbi:hypothetical protein SNEBB_002707 [Seison nebaliae]|nr:hypothetical protein SNEBB_002707 [Seison nebaliae]